MEKTILIGIDIGSTNIKTVIFDTELNILANEANEIEIYYPKPGWTEYDPASWWEHVKDTLRRALKNAKSAPQAVLGVGVSSLGCCTVPLDEDGNHIYNAIPWHDHRAGEEVAFLEKHCRDQIYNACSNIPTVLSATPHLMWLKKHEPDIYSKMHKYTEASGFIVQKLTQQFVLDYSMASALDYGFNIHNLTYDEELIAAMELDVEKYPNLHDNRKCVSGITEIAARETGLLEGTPVYLGGLDIVTAALSVGAVKPGQGFYSMGSASNMMIVAEKNKQTERMTSIVHVVNPELKFLFGSQATIGFSLKWFSEQFCEQEKMAAQILNNKINVFEILSSEAAKVDPGSGGVIYLPFLFGKFHPIFNPNSTGAFLGITATTTKAQMIRSVMEGCTFNMYETIKSASQIGIALDEIIASGGPTNSDIWCQIIADVTNITVRTITTSEATPLGNAIIVGNGEGLFDGFEQAIEQHITYDRVFTPDPKRHKRYEELFVLYNKFYEVLLPVYEDLADIKSRLLH